MPASASSSTTGLNTSAFYEIYSLYWRTIMAFVGADDCYNTAKCVATVSCRWACRSQGPGSNGKTLYQGAGF